MQNSIGVSTDEKIPYAERVAAAKREVRKHVEASGVPHIAGLLTTLMMTSIRINATQASEGELELGSSRLGGIPDLPEDIAWPDRDGVPMALLAQFRLEDVAGYDADERLPKTGMLYFFYDAKKQPWGFDPKDKDGWKVLYYDGDPSRLRPMSTPTTLPEESRFRACRVTFGNDITLPSCDSHYLEHLNLSYDEQMKYYEIPGAALGLGGPIYHRLLGHPGELQAPMQRECQLTSNGLYTGDYRAYCDDPRLPDLDKGVADWQLLLQIDSDEEDLGAMWGDCGRVYFWIRQQDLEKRDFSNVWVVLQCC